jgi:hypothetical protein
MAKFLAKSEHSQIWLFWTQIDGFFTIFWIKI